MSISLTRILQQITGLNTFFAGPSASRDNGVVLLDTATVTWGTDGQGNIQATAAGGSAPTGTANLVYATPNGSSGSASLRALVTADLPAGLGGLSLIQTQTVSGTPASVTFSAIPQTYTSLLVVCTMQSSAVEAMQIQFNGDTGTNYSTLTTTNLNGSLSANAASAQTSSNVGVAGNTGTSSATITIPNYAQTVFAKTALSSSVVASSSFIFDQFAAIWNSTAAINEIVLTLDASATFVAGSTFSLYGMQ